MKPLGKCLRIANRNNQNKESAIRDLLLAYRTTPHPATGLSPGEMLFRHGYRGAYPNRKSCTNEAFDEAVDKMKKDKVERCHKINSSIRRKDHCFEVGQWVLISRKQRRKFDPLYHEEPWIIETLNKTGARVHNPQKTKSKTLHIDDIKPYVRKACNDSGNVNQEATLEATFTLPKNNGAEHGHGEGEDVAGVVGATPPEEEEHQQQQDPPTLRRSNRKKTCTRDTKYSDFVEK